LLVAIIIMSNSQSLSQDSVNRGVSFSAILNLQKVSSPTAHPYTPVHSCTSLMASSGYDSGIAQDARDSLFKDHPQARQVAFEELVNAVIPLHGNDANLDKEVCDKLLSDRLVNEHNGKSTWLINETGSLSAPDKFSSEKQAFNKAIPALINGILECCSSIRNGRALSVKPWANGDDTTASFLIASHRHDGGFSVQDCMWSPGERACAEDFEKRNSLQCVVPMEFQRTKTEAASSDVSNYTLPLTLHY
jgi:hypothetical protein